MAAEGSQRSYLRDRDGPRAVDAGQRGSSRRKESGSDDRDARKSGRSSASKSSSSKSSGRSSGHKRKSSSSQSSVKEASSKPSYTYELNVIGQPPKAIPYGMDVEASVMVSIRFSSPDRAEHFASKSTDSSGFFGVASLVAETRAGERIPVEAGSLTGQKLFDSVHAIPGDSAETMRRSDPCRVALGYFTFSGLLIRQPGTYHIRTTLIQMAASESGSQGGTSVMSIDSEQIRVERRPTTGQRTAQRIYA